MEACRVDSNHPIMARGNYRSKRNTLMIVDSIIVVFLLTAAIFSTLMFIIPISEDVSAATLYVGGAGGGNYSTIQQAIDAAMPGDTVYVYTKTYYEILLIDKSINLIGENILGNRPVIDGYGNPNVVHVDNVNNFYMSEFEVRNSSIDPLYPSGIFIDSSSNVNIINNVIHDNRDGIMVYYSSFINIQDNEIYYNKANGIQSDHSSLNNYINNTVHDHWGEGFGGHGFFFSGCPYQKNNIIGNILYNNTDGIHLEDDITDNNRFGGNLILNNTVYNYEHAGIFIGTGLYNSVIGNLVYNITAIPVNPTGGIFLWSSENNLVTENIVYNGDIGIYLDDGVSYPGMDNLNNTVKDNTVYNNINGIGVRQGGDNTFIGNLLFDNDYNVYIEQQSFNSNFINNTLSNANTNVFIKEQSSNNDFINCTLSNSSVDDFNLTDSSYALTLNTTFDKTKVYYGDTLSTLTVKWFMHVNVIYYNGTPVNGAEIWVNDTLGANILNGQVDFQGWTRWIVVTEYIEWDADGDNIGDKLYYTTHHDTATDGILWGYADPFMDISKVVRIFLGTPPHLLPPTNLTTKVVNNSNNVELEWGPPNSPILDHYLIYRADSQTEFDFTTPYNSSASWSNPLNTTWIDPDPSITQIDDDFYYIVRAANSDESDISSTSNTAGIWTRTFEPGISTFSLPLVTFVKKDAEFYCQDMNASYIKWMNHTIHTWMKHDKGYSENNTLLELGEGYEVKFDNQTRHTFCGMPGTMIIYDDENGFSGFDPNSEAKNLSVTVEPNGDVTLIWQEPSSMIPGDWYEIYSSNTRDGFFRTFGADYDLACPPISYGTNSTTISGLGASDPGVRLYFMVVPLNASGVRGSSSYSICVWTEEYLSEYDTLGIPLKLTSYRTTYWYCNNIPDCVGINYYIYNDQRWGWHSTRMPAGAFDVVLEMGVGYQISTSGATKFTFIGI